MIRLNVRHWWNTLSGPTRPIHFSGCLHTCLPPIKEASSSPPAYWAYLYSAFHLPLCVFSLSISTALQIFPSFADLVIETQMHSCDMLIVFNHNCFIALIRRWIPWDTAVTCPTRIVLSSIRSQLPFQHKCSLRHSAGCLTFKKMRILSHIRRYLSHTTCLLDLDWWEWMRRRWTGGRTLFSWVKWALSNQPAIRFTTQSRNRVGQGATPTRVRVWAMAHMCNNVLVWSVTVKD